MFPDKKYFSCLMRIVLVDEKKEPLTLIPIGWPNSQEKYWKGAAAVKVSDTHVIVLTKNRTSAHMCWKIMNNDDGIYCNVWSENEKV